MSFGEKNSYFMQSLLVLFCLKECHGITIFLENQKVPLLLKISININCPRSNPPTLLHHQHTNFVQGTQGYSLSLKCAYTSSDSWIRHWFHLVICNILFISIHLSILHPTYNTQVHDTQVIISSRIRTIADLLISSSYVLLNPDIQ